MTALDEDHPATHTLFKSRAGLATDPYLITNCGSQLEKTICHELLHNLGTLRDLSDQAKDNIMFYEAGSTDTLLRRRKTEHQYTSGPCGTGTRGTDEQWIKIPR